MLPGSVYDVAQLNHASRFTSVRRLREQHTLSSFQSGGVSNKKQLDIDQ
jgi:hypothetical protein